MKRSRTTPLIALLALSSLLVIVAVTSFFLSRPPAAATPSGSGTDSPPTAAGSRSAVTYEQGKALFMDKGCARCHSHSDVGKGLAVGPDLTALGSPSSELPSDPGYLRTWLKDPQAIRPNTVMPDLDLSDEEIDGLLAFLLAGPGESPSVNSTR